MLQTNQEQASELERRRATAEDAAAAERRCIVTRESKPKSELLRFVVAPDGAVVPDMLGALPGRGIWVSADRASVEAAVAKRLFSRAAQRQVTVDPALADRIEAQLLRRCLDLIGLARRGGGAVSGFEKVRAFLAKSPVGVLLAASDGADDGREKMERLAHGAPIVSALNRQELGRAFGREQVVHAVVASGKIADQLRAAARRLSGFRQKSAE
jgi:predicted RNA-binding protein YlxR (DUF448 family)